MKQTENLALNLPEGPDNYDVNDYNENFEIIDEKMKYLADHIGGGGVLEEKTIYTNGIYTPPEGVNGWNKIIAAVTPALMNRTITENGVYTASQEEPVSYEGYGTVIVDVKPAKVLISEFDFKGLSPYYDKVKNVEITTLMRGLSYTQGTGITATARGNKLRTGTIFDYAGIYEIEIKFGTFDRTTALTNGNNMLLKVGINSAKLMLNYYYNSSTDTGKWWLHDQSGNNIYLDYGENNPYYFENKTLIMTYGAKYVDDELIRDRYKGYFYVNGVQLNSNGAAITGDDDSQVQVVFLCDSINNAFVGAVYESLKIWQYFNKYEAPASLMMAAPEEAEELRAEIEEEPEAEEIKQEEEKETEETKEAGLLENEKSE